MVYIHIQLCCNFFVHKPSTYPFRLKENTDERKNTAKHFRAIFIHFLVILKLELLSIWSFPPRSPFSSVYYSSGLTPVRCQVKVEVCIVPVLSHNRWGGNEFKDIVEEGSPVLKQRAHIQGNDPYSVLWVYVTQAHKGSFIAQLSYATLHLFLQIMGIMQWSQSLCFGELIRWLILILSHIRCLNH